MYGPRDLGALGATPDASERTASRGTKCPGHGRQREATFTHEEAEAFITLHSSSGSARWRGGSQMNQ